MANVTRTVLQRSSLVSRALSTSAAKQGSQTPAIPDAFPRLGEREIVGPGYNNQPNYMDRTDYPFPAIRFKPEDLPEVKTLREKEKGDWKQLTIDEKKALYRASFRQTLIECEAPSGEWKSVLAAILLGLSVTGWMMIYLRNFVYPELPRSINQEWQEAQVKRMVVQRQGAVDGIANKFDYENNKWK